MASQDVSSLHSFSAVIQHKVTSNPPGHNPSSTVFKWGYNELSATEDAGAVRHTACTSHMRWLRNTHTHLDLVIQSPRSSPPLSCTSSWCCTSLPESSLQWTPKPVLSGHKREVVALTGLMENQSEWLLRFSHQPSGMTRNSPFSMRKQKCRSLAIIHHKFKTH